MTREQLESYKSMLQEIAELKDSLGRLGEGDSMLCSSVIKDYRSGYPVPQAVVGVDWRTYDQRKAKYEKQIRALQKECEAIEEYVEAIGDSLIRRIFRMYFLEGKTQREIAKLIHMDRSTVSRKLSAPAH